MGRRPMRIHIWSEQVIWFYLDDDNKQLHYARLGTVGHGNRHSTGRIILFSTLMMEVVRTSEPSVYSETTLRYIPEGYHLQHYSDSIQHSPSSDVARQSACQ
jgi:hypothetical protein